MENSEPSEDNKYCQSHARLLIESFRLRTGRELLELDPRNNQIGRALYFAPFAVVSHGTEEDPIFNYGNAAALELFGMTWEEFTSMSSRLSAEPMHRDERERFMTQVRLRGCVQDYRGIRVSKQGRRFLIEQATVWTVNDEAGTVIGQAAVLPAWRYLDEEAKGPR